MNSFFAIFGKTPAISTAEIFTCFKQQNIQPNVSRVASVGIIGKTDETLPSTFWNMLGGIVKAGEILIELKGSASFEELLTALKEDALQRVGREFGISIYLLENKSEAKAVSLKTLGARLKKELVEEGKSARHVTSRDATLSAVTISRNKLLKSGVEYCIFIDAGLIAIGKTTWVQPYEEYAEREFSRPGANARSGMVPVKLARMLVNLTGVSQNAIFLDPFCGSGTILSEALSLGFTNVIGADIFERAVIESKKNVTWTLKHLHKDFPVRIEEHDVKNIDAVLAAGFVDAIATEPYLGPPLKGGERPETIERIRNELLDLYEGAFKTFEKILTPGAPVVILFPYFEKTNLRLADVFIQRLDKKNFKTEHLLPERYEHTPGFVLTREGGLIYKRPGQHIGREILCFRKLDA